MKLLKKVFTGFVTFSLLYAAIVMFAPWFLYLLNITINIKMHLFSVDLGEIFTNSNEMYGIVTHHGILLAGLIGVLLTISFHYLSKIRTHYSPF
ncbi:hypothetical protein [Metabacillus malikii]|uniref:Uncharacterized protein n=1 Tax=Metabacillus malikii TaxID=1504265 RepID=A0ABT9ZDG1_9BACI|nr:hypothetical protein [Metabacillus malikii]MDQ0230296.1 hypothetical protein [Metabacillus malikii]